MSDLLSSIVVLFGHHVSDLLSSTVVLFGHHMSALLSSTVVLFGHYMSALLSSRPTVVMCGHHMSDLLSSIVVLFGHRINSRSLINLKVFIQRNFTKKLFELEHLTYNNCFRVLIADTLEIGRIKPELIFYYKIFHKLVDLEKDDFLFVITRTLVAIILR